MSKYAMVIKTNLCTGCQTCSVACKMENLTLPGCSRTIVREQLDAKWEVKTCMQCDNPPCVSICPTKATWKNDIGIIVIDQDKCIGCGKCVSACPYQARHINPKSGYFKKRLPFEEVSLKIKENHRIHKPTKVDKCDFCLHRISNNKLPMCVEACPTGARIFGDMENSQSEVSKLITKGATPLKPELGTKPKVFYI
jgi:molybdopterin-containing oxidoreductase family iron-sulfur binding subunit